MKIKRGSTSVRRLIFIADSSSTTGAGLANLSHNSAGLVAFYMAGDLSADVQITLVSATLGTFTSGGFVAVDNTGMPGWYEIGIPNAALDGGNEVAIQLRGAANMVPVQIYIELDAIDYQTAQATSEQAENIKSRLPDALVNGNIKADALRVGGVAQTGRDLGAGVLLTPGTGTGQVSLTSGKVDINDKTGFTTVIEQRLSETRAGYLDNLSGGAVPTLAQILAGGDIDGFTLEQTLKLCLSALAGKLSGAAGTTITIRSVNDTENRIVATVDSSGNRSAVTLNAAG